MSSYEVRIHKRNKSNKSLYDVVNCVTFEAADDNHARRMAPLVPVPRFNDRDMALVFSSDERLIMRLYS